MAVVSDVEIRLRADIARLRQDMQDARREVSGALNSMSTAAEAFKGVLSGMAAGLSIGAFASFIKNSIDATDALNDMSTRTKVAIEDLAGLSFAAKLGDTSLEGVAGAISKLGTNIGKDGAKFRELGITATEPLEAFKQLADIFKNIQDPQQRAAFGAEALDKSWQEAAVVLENGSQGLTDLIKHGKELSGVTEQTAADAGRFNDKLDELGFAAQGTGVRIAAGLLPTLDKMAEAYMAARSGSDKLAGAITVLSGGLKGIFSAGIVVVELFRTLGKAAGAAAAITVAALSGNFRDAVSMYKTFALDIRDDWVGAAKQVSTVWSASAADVAKSADDAANATGDSTKKVAAFLNAGEIAAARAKAAAAAEAAAKKEQAGYAGIIVSIKEKMAADQAEITGSAALTDIQKLRIKIDAELATGKIKLTKEHRDEIDALIDDARALEKNAAAAKQVRAAVAALADERDKNYESIIAEAEANEKLVATFGKTKKQIEELNLARDVDRLARRGDLELGEDTVAQLEREIDARKRNIAAMGNLEILEKQKKAAEDAATAQKEFWKSIDTTAHDTFVSILDGSKGTAQRLKDTFKNVFFDWLYQQTIKKWIISIGTDTSSTGSAVSSIASLFGGSGGGASGSGAGGILGTASNLFSIGKTIYSGFSTGLASSLGGTISTLGTTFGSEAVAAFGAGMQGGALGASTASAASGYAGTTAAGAGAGAAGAVPIIGWIIAGMMASKGLYQQGWDSHNGSVSNVGRLAGGNAAIWSDTMLQKLGMSKVGANILSGQATIAKMFGRKNPEIESQGLRGTLTATGTTDAENYVNVLQKGGWFRSDKRWTDKAAASTSTDKLFDDTMTAMVGAVKTFGQAMGIETKAIDDYSKVFDIKLTGDATKDNEAVAKLFADVGDELSLRLVPGLASFTKEGETLSTTLQRLAVDYQSVDAILATTSQTIKSVGVAGIDAREILITAAGGLDKLATGVGNFQQTFFTDAEKLAPVQKQVAAALAAMGMSAVKTNDQFKAAVLGIDLNTKAGADLYVQMLALAPAFKQVADSAKAQADAAIAAAQASSAAAQASSAAVQELLKARETLLRSVVSAAYDALEAAVAARKDVLAKAYAEAIKGIESSIASLNTSIATTQRLSDALKAGLGTVASAGATSGSLSTASSDIAQALAVAQRTGVLPSAESLAAALATVNRDNSGEFSTLIEYQRSVARTNNDIAALGGAADKQLTVQERQLLALEAQKDATDAQYQAEVDRLDLMLEDNKKMVEIALGQYTALVGINTGMANLAAALSNLKASFPSTTGVPGGPLTGDTGGPLTVAGLYQAVLGRAADAAGAEFWTKAFGAVIDENEYADFVKSAQAELNSRNTAWMAPQGATATSSTNPNAAIDALNTQMDGMQAAMNRTAAATTQLADQFSRVSGNGNALATESIK